MVCKLVFDVIEDEVALKGVRNKNDLIKTFDTADVSAQVNSLERGQEENQTAKEEDPKPKWKMNCPGTVIF